MKRIELSQLELEILVDALRSQTRLGHLNDIQSIESTKLLFKILKKHSEPEKDDN